MSDDGWYGEPQEPTPTPGYGQRRANRAAYGQDERGGQSGQYPQQPAQSGGYQQDPYRSGQYSQDYAAQQPYYDELGPRSTAPQGWNSAPQEYSNPQSYQQSYGQQSYESQQPYQSQPQTPHGQGQYPRRGEAPRPNPDPYASGSYGNDAYGSASDAYGTGSYASGTYSSPGQSSSGRASQSPHSSGTYPADPYASGGYGRPGRDGYSTGEYPGTERDPRRRSGEYPINRGAPGRGPGSAQSSPQTQEPYARRRGAALDTSGDYAQYEDDDEFPGASRSSGRGSGFSGESASRAAGSSPRGRRRSAEPADAMPQDEPNSGRFSLIDDEDEEPGSARGRKPKQKKGRNCLAVFIAFSVIAGGLGYGGYKGVQWYQSKYGTPPDYSSTTGTGAKVDVTIPTGAGGRTIGGLLFSAGVVKSQRAFTDACNSDPKCANIQAGTYLLPKGVSAEAAIAFLLDPKNQDSKSRLITYGGERAAQVFAALETKTGWKDADIRAAIAGGQIDLPSWDTGQPGAKFPYAHIEGFIAAESYVLTDYKTPTDLLKKMVDDQMAVFNQENLTAKASSLGLDPYKTLIIASLARAEAGTNTADLNKIAGVVFNRFKDPTQFAHLGFDTATLYGMGNTTTVPNNKDTTNPYNTSVYGIKGLPPSPIDNPDQASVDAALNPNRANDYLYFCATPDGVMYAANNTQWQQLGAKYKGLCGSR